MSLIDRYRGTLIWIGALTLVLAVVTIIAHYLTSMSLRWLWLAVITGGTAGAFFYDKTMSRRQIVARRIPEKALLWLCLIGGTLGGLVVMLGRRHKTIDSEFKLAMGIIIGLQIGALVFWLFNTLTAP